MEAYSADRSLTGKLRRRLVRLVERRPARMRLERAMVSFSFDDAPASATRAGARALETRGLRATYYVSAGLAGRDYVIPDDVKFLAVPALRHRVVLAPGAEIEGLTADQVVQQLVQQTAAPR